MAKPKPFKTDFRPHDKMLLVSFILGPLSAVTNVTISYFLSQESCVQGSKTILHLTSAAFLLLAVSGVFMARLSGTRAAAVSTDALKERVQWLTTAAMALGVGSVLVIIASEIPNLILRSCD
ncbi:MAG TPA: hypothetical protein VEK11_21240 [Thermoanaerobaculia bacterium]|nr:hypothetical protein [Thermoanaerobaculia bacterium]